MFAALALLVTITGITGVIAQSVSQRTQGSVCEWRSARVRTACSAWCSARDCYWSVSGSIIGIGASFALARVLQTYLSDHANGSADARRRRHRRSSREHWPASVRPGAPRTPVMLALRAD